MIPEFRKRAKEDVAEGIETSEVFGDLGGLTR